MQPVSAGTAVAVAPGAVPGEIDEGVPAVRCLAVPQPLALPGDDEEGQRHPAVRGQMIGDRRARREVVDMPVVPVVIGQLRSGARRGHQRVQLCGRGAVVPGREDPGEPRADGPYGGQIARPERADIADVVALYEVLEGREIGQTVRRSGPFALRGGIEQIDDRVQRAPGVMGDDHGSAPWQGGAGRVPPPWVAEWSPTLALRTSFSADSAVGPRRRRRSVPCELVGPAPSPRVGRAQV